MQQRLQAIFFQLLQLGLWGKGRLSLSSPLSAKDWEVLYRYAKNHTVEGILFDAFEQLNPEQLPPLALRMKWAVRIDQMERYNQKMAKSTAALYAFFTTQGLRPILLKGQGVANCYRQPEHRVSGDIDWYFQDQGYDRAYQSLVAKKLPVHVDKNFCLDYAWQGIAVEHHRQVFDIHSRFKTRYLLSLEAAYRDRQQSLHLGGQNITILAPELQIVQVNIHILKHLLAFGIGLRQICDAAVLYHNYHQQINPQELQQIFKKLGILPWIQLLHYVLVKYLGLPKSELPFAYPDDTSADWMLNEIWQAGNFGFHDERFQDGKTTFVSKQPDGTRRLLRNMRLYYPYAPQEVLFFPIKMALARLSQYFYFRKKSIQKNSSLWSFGTRGSTKLVYVQLPNLQGDKKAK